jgi:surface polysaccharide O-acyltransferase-like enzyme
MKPATRSANEPSPIQVGAAPKESGRLFFVDNIRAFLTILVILHHLMVIYAGTGNWIYTEGRQDFAADAVGGWFCATNQAYFMGLFLLISAYFVPGSYDRKGAGRFLKDRLIRLGIPLAVYSWVINPIFVYLRYFNDLNMPFFRFFPGEYFKDGALIGHGPLWFVEVLLIFSLAYVGWRLLGRDRPAPQAAETRFPTNAAIALFALGLGIAGFIVRIFFAMDAYSFRLLNLQFPFFAQYIALFVVGLIAYRRNWLWGLPEGTGRLWLGIAVLMVFLWIPVVILGGALTDDALLKGGLHWQSLLYALWEAFLCVSMCVGLIYAFRRYLNRRGKITEFFAPNAYTAYLIHAPVITFLALAARDIALYPLLKWAVMAAIAIPICFGLSSLIRRLPYAEKVL